MLVKLIGNHMILTFGELLAEVSTFLGAGGVGAQVAKSALMDELMPRVFYGYVQRLTDEPGASKPSDTAIGRKDNALLTDAARAMGVDLAFARCIEHAQGRRTPQLTLASSAACVAGRDRHAAERAMRG